MLRRCFLLFVLLGFFTGLSAKAPVPLRLVSFDPTVRKVGKSDAQQATLALVEGRQAGKTYTVNLAPSEKTAGLVGRQLYLRLPLDWLAQQDFVFYAGDLLDLDPVPVPPDFFVSIPLKDDVADKEATMRRYTAARVALDGINEVNGTFVPPADPARWTSAADAIAAAAKNYPDGVQGSFVFVVRGTGEELGGTLWLNSEADYHSPQSLNVSLHRLAKKDLELRLKNNPAEFLKGKRIVVTGIAQCVKIVPFKETDAYFQTQVHLWSAHQIRILP